MLEERYAGSRLSGLLVSRKDFRPFPTVSERAEWERLPDRVKGRIVKEGERYLEFTWSLCGLRRLWTSCARVNGMSSASIGVALP